MMLLWSLLIVGLVSVQGYPTGAPTESCNSMTPGHKAEPQATPFPYKLELSQNNINSGQSIQIILSGIGGETFRGYMIQARDAQQNIQGSFSGDGHTIDCNGGKGNTATHSERGDKTKAELTWTPPQDYVGIVTFHVTVVKTYEIFWVDYTSEPLQVSAQ